MKPLTMCRFIPHTDDTGRECWAAYPFSKYEKFLYMGDIVQMPGHSVIIQMTTGQVLCGYHSDNFEAIPEDEV